MPIPEVGPAFQKRHIFFSHRRLPKRAVGGVLKRAHHSRDVTERGPFQFTFAQWSRRFAFEIKNNEILSSVEQLTKMIIAMNTDLRGIGVTIEQPFFACEDLLFSIEHFFRFVAELRRKVA